MDSFKVVLSNTEYIGKDGSSMSEKQYEKSEPRNQNKKILGNFASLEVIYKLKTE